MSDTSSPRPMRVFVDGLRWLDRYRETQEFAAANVPKLPPEGSDDMYALAYARGSFETLEEIMARFVGCGNLTEDEIWRRLQEANVDMSAPADRTAVRAWRNS